MLYQCDYMHLKLLKNLRNVLWRQYIETILVYAAASQFWFKIFVLPLYDVHDPSIPHWNFKISDLSNHDN